MAELRLAEARLADAQWLNPGFTQDSLLNHLFKKSVNRTDTSLRTSYFKEPLAQPKYFLDYLATENIPTQAPDDFEPLNNTQIADLFKISESDIIEFNTLIRGVSTFSIERSVSKNRSLHNSLCLKPAFAIMSLIASGSSVAFKSL